MSGKKTSKSNRVAGSTETKHAFFKKRRYKILEIKIKDNTVINREVAVEIWQQIMEFGYPKLIFFNSKDAHYSWRLEGLTSLIEAKLNSVSIASIPQGSLSDETIDFLVELMSPHFDLKAFKTEKEALAWLRERGKDH